MAKVTFLGATQNKNLLYSILRKIDNSLNIVCSFFSADNLIWIIQFSKVNVDELLIAFL